MPTLPSPADATAAARIEDLLAAAELAAAVPPPIRRRGGPRAGSFRVVYLLPRTSAGEGARALLAHANHLAALGAEVTLVSHFPRPDWYPVRTSFVQVPFGEPVEEAVPPCDLIVAGYWEFVLPARRLALAPVVHFEQGDFHLYEDVPEQVRTVVAASLRAAHATIAVGDDAVAALAERYGVVATPVVHGVDVAGFTRRAPGPRPATGTVLFTGWDGHGSKGIATAREVARLMAKRRPGLRVRWATPSPPTGAPFGEVVLAASEEELARCYREADVYVCCSEHESFATAPLEAMASGTPVVSTANTGVAAYAREGENLLLAPVGDAAALAAAAGRVLDDPELAARLAEAGAATAEDRSWPRVAAGLLDLYRGVVADHPPEAPLGAFALELDGLSFDRPGGRALLEARLAGCATTELAIPVSQPAVSGHRIVRWQVVARRGAGVPGVTRAYLPARSAQRLENVPHQPGLELLRRRRPEAALDWFVAACHQAGRAEQAVLGRWVVLALLASERPADAADVAVAFARDFPSHPDFLYLGVVSCLAARRPVEIAGPLEGIRLLGRGARHEEWFDDPAGLLTAHLAAA